MQHKRTQYHSSKEACTSPSLIVCLLRANMPPPTLAVLKERVRVALRKQKRARAVRKDLQRKMEKFELRLSQIKVGCGRDAVGPAFGFDMVFGFPCFSGWASCNPAAVSA